MRIKDVASLGGLRDNQLVGYGLVVGLQGTGDSMRNAPFTEQAMQVDAGSDGRERAQHPASRPQRRGRDRDHQPDVAGVQGVADRRHGLGPWRCNLPAGRHADHDPADGRRRADPCRGPGLRVRVGLKRAGPGRNLLAGRANGRAHPERRDRGAGSAARRLWRGRQYLDARAAQPPTSRRRCGSRMSSTASRANISG